MNEAVTIGEWLRRAAANLQESDTPALDARVVAAHVLALDDAALIRHANDVLTADARARLDNAIARRARGEPVAYIIGEKEFWGLRFKLAPGVLTPRPDSETLIEAILKRRARDGVWRILDLGTGSGCLLGALLSEFPNATGAGVDLDPASIATARENMSALGFNARARIIEGDFAAPPASAFDAAAADIVISNPPYIEEGAALPRDVANYENALALFAGADGLDAYRRIFPALRAMLRPKGIAVFEFGAGQAGPLADLAKKDFPGVSITIENDLAGRPRALIIDLGGERR